MGCSMWHYNLDDFPYLGFSKRKEIHFPLRCRLLWAFSQSLAALRTHAGATRETKMNQEATETMPPLHLERCCIQEFVYSEYQIPTCTCETPQRPKESKVKFVHIGLSLPPHLLIYLFNNY